MVRPDGGAAVKVNPGRTQAAMGGIDGDLLVYQQFRRKNASLKFVDLDTMQGRKAPEGVNSRRGFEYWPSVSGPWLQFGVLARNGARRLLLHNMDTGEERALDATQAKKAFIGPGQVNGDYAVWSTCKPRCQVFRHHIPTGTTVMIPNEGFFQRAPSVSPDGTVYFSRGGKRCGVSVSLMRYPIGGPAEPLVQLQNVLDIHDTFVFVSPGGGIEVFYERNGCGRAAASDIYKVLDAAPLGSITVRKDAIPNDVQDFTFDPSPNLFGPNFALDDDGDPGLPNEAFFGSLLAGTYSVREVSIPVGWQLTGLTCTGGGDDTSTSIPTATATIELDPGENVLCTFTDTKGGRIRVDKSTIPDGHLQEFEFDPSWDPSNFFLQDDERETSGFLPPGTYSVEELEPSNWLVAAVCDDGSDPESSISLSPGEVVTCTFTNTETL